MGRGDGPRSPNVRRRGERGDSSKNTSTTNTVRGHRARSSLANSEASSTGIGLPSLGDYRRGATKEPRKRGLLVCCFKAYSRGQKRWSSLTAPEEEEGEVAWGLSSREEEAQVRQLACEGLGMTDAEVGRFVKAFQSVAMEHAIDVPAFLELAQMCDSHGEGPHAPLARSLFLYYHNLGGGGLGQATQPPRASIQKEAIDVTQRLSAVDDAVPQSFHDTNPSTVESGVALMSLPLFLLTCWHLCSCRRDQVEALVWDCYTRRDAHRPGFDGTIMSEEACMILLHHLMGVRHSSDRRGSKATPESAASVVEMLAVVRQGDKRILNNTHITKSMLMQFLRTKPVVLAPVLRLQQCLAMAITGTSSKGQAFWDWVQDARSRCLTEEQATWPNLAEALLPPSPPPPFVMTMDRGTQGCRGNCLWWVACLMSSLCCIIGCDRPLSDASRHRRQTRRPYTSSTIAPSSPLASTANNTSTNQSRRSLSGASSPSHTMSSRGQGMTEGVADVASETLRSSGRLSKHTTTSSPKTERDRAHKESLAQLLDSATPMGPPTDPSATQNMRNSMRMTTSAALHSTLTVSTSSPGLTNAAAPNRFAALNTPSSPEGRHQSPLGSPSHKQAQAFLNSTLQNSQRIAVEDKNGSTTYK